MVTGLIIGEIGIGPVLLLPGGGVNSNRLTI